MKSEWNGMVFLLWGLVLVSALAVIYSTHRSRQMFDELEGLSQEQNRLEVEWGRLLLERSTRSSLGAVESAVRSWGMREPAMSDVRVMQP